MTNRALPLSIVEAYVPLARKLGVSKVARSSRGFLAAYRKAGGKLSNMSEAWRRKRDGFIVRHLAQVNARREPLLLDNDLPTRRHLALIMWAYSPLSASILRRFAPR